MGLTEEEKNNIYKFISEMESITEDWERKLCFTAMVDAVLWGKEVDIENKKNKNKSLKDKYNIQ